MKKLLVFALIASVYSLGAVAQDSKPATPATPQKKVVAAKGGQAAVKTTVVKKTKTVTKKTN